MKPLYLVYRFASAWQEALGTVCKRIAGVLAASLLLGLLLWGAAASLG